MTVSVCYAIEMIFVLWPLANCSSSHCPIIPSAFRTIEAPTSHPIASMHFLREEHIPIPPCCTYLQAVRPDQPWGQVASPTGHQTWPSDGNSSTFQGMMVSRLIHFFLSINKCMLCLQGLLRTVLFAGYTGQGNLFHHFVVENKMDSYLVPSDC